MSDDDDPAAAHKDRWNLVVLEDCGELLTKDAKTRTGQALSRLLNVTDGIIGQGLKVLVLITTNEESGALHEAASRPGRCLSRIEFGNLTTSESDAWRLRHGLPVSGQQATLAELYAEARGSRPKAAKKAVGFVREN